MTERNQQRYEARVSQFWPEKHYGFLTVCRGELSGRTFFFHVADCIEESPERGDRVEFSIGSRKGREKAVSVVLTEKSQFATEEQHQHASPTTQPA